MNADLKPHERLMSNSMEVVGIAADHGGHELKEYLIMMLREAGVEVIDFGNRRLIHDDDYPDFVVPLARAVAEGQVDRGIAICGSGVGACVVANKVNAVRACLIHDSFSAHQGVEDDDLNLICLGGLVVGHALAWDLVRRFLAARFSGEERHRRRLGKMSVLEHHAYPQIIRTSSTCGVTVMQSEKPASEDSSSETAPLKIHLIRHGETEWSLDGRHTGLTDLPLTARGEDEVREWGQFLCNIPFSHVLTSPLQRARRTCELVGLGEDAVLEGDLAEWDYGDYEGLQSVEIWDKQPGWNVFHDVSPNGETPDQVSARADRLISRLRSMHGNIALFSHGHFGCVLAARWIGLPVIEGQHLSLGTASLGIFGYSHHHPEVSVIELWNSAPHQVTRAAASHSTDHMSLKQGALQRW